MWSQRPSPKPTSTSATCASPLISAPGSIRSQRTSSCATEPEKRTITLFTSANTRTAATTAAALSTDGGAYQPIQTQPAQIVTQVVTQATQSASRTNNTSASTTKSTTTTAKTTAEEDTGLIASGKEENVNWMLYKDGKLILNGYGNMSDSFDMYNDHPWLSFLVNDYSAKTNIDPYSFIKTVIIENGVTSIGPYAFYYCKGLKEITIPKKVTALENSHFYNCSSPVTIDFADLNAVTAIGGFVIDGTPFTGDSTFAGSDGPLVFCRNNITIDRVKEKHSYSWNDIPAGQSNIAAVKTRDVTGRGINFNFYNVDTPDNFSIDALDKNGFSSIFLSSGQYGTNAYHLDGSSTVNMKDLVALQRYVNGWNTDLPE